MKKALSPEFKAIAANAINSFGNGYTSQRILDVIQKYLADGPHTMKKIFYDIEVTM
jgi:UDP-N-acetylglucosamine 2-epimerase